MQPNRRKFLTQVGAATIAASVIKVEAQAATGSNQRANECAKLRRDAAIAGLQATPQNLQHPNNEDENLYPNKIGNFSKGLPHNNDGTVVLSAYNALVNAINSGRPADFDAIPLGGTRGLTNPQSGLAFDLQGPDAHALVQPPAGVTCAVPSLAALGFPDAHGPAFPAGTSGAPHRDRSARGREGGSPSC